MGKEARNRNYRHNKNKPYKKDGWKNRSDGDRNSYGGARRENKKAGDHNRTFVPKNNLREDQAAITEYVRSGAGFTGVVKSRFSDFQVNEIDCNGKVLVLNDLHIPHQAEEDPLSAEEISAMQTELADVISPDVWTKIKVLAFTKPNAKVNAETIEIDVNELDKEKRTQVHKVLKQLYAGKLVSTTFNKEVLSTTATETGGDGVKQERKFFKITKPKGGYYQNRNNWNFPGEFVHFLLHKENMETSEVAAAMAVRLNLRPSQVNYCGTKDKRAKTTQKFCIKKRSPSQIINSIKMLHNVHIGNFEFSNEVLKLGQLQGNRFRIVLRHVSGDIAGIEKALENLREHGFINYFGLQRFGNCADIPTYEVGVALLKSDYKLACELILKPRENDIHFMRAIRETWWKKRNSLEAANMIRSDKFIEKKLLDGLAEYGENDYASALRKIPRNMLLLYPHAFQSFVFNQIASRRIKEFGLKLMPGDLVYRNKDELDLDNTIVLTDELDNSDDKGENEEETAAAETVVTTETAATETAATETTAAADGKDNDNKTESIFKRKVKSLSAEDIASGDYNIFDVVLPLPGYDITYPDNVVGSWYEETLQKHELSSEKLRHNVKTYAMAGAYRKLVIQPTQMSWKFCDYDSAESPLISSDWEQLKGEPLTLANEGKFKALILEFCLPTAAYATMLLRELLKTDTSAATQTQLEIDELKKMSELANSLVAKSQPQTQIEGAAKEESTAENLDFKQNELKQVADDETAMAKPEVATETATADVSNATAGKRKTQSTDDEVDEAKKSKDTDDHETTVKQ